MVATLQSGPHFDGALSQPAQPVIRIEKDLVGQQMAARALLEQAFQRSAIDVAFRLADKDTRQQLLDGMSDLDLSPGYYARAGYLFELRSTIRAGVVFAAGDLTRDDVRGLLALDRAEAEFNRAHPACSGCNTRQDNPFAFKCRGCGMKFSRGDR